jgi:hypothetical protein
MKGTKKTLGEIILNVDASEGLRKAEMMEVGKYQVVRSYIAEGTILEEGDSPRFTIAEPKADGSRDFYWAWEHGAVKPLMGRVMVVAGQRYIVASYVGNDEGELSNAGTMVLEDEYWWHG